MSSTNKTPNYGLPQYIDTDKPTFLGDFNDAMGIIDKGMNDNKNSAGEGSNKMDEANARIGDAEKTLTETQNQVDSISGLADTIETKVQTALTQANDAATKSGQANTNSTVAVNAANQASTDANAALQQAQGNVSQINGLGARVTALESAPKVTVIKTNYSIGSWAPNIASNNKTNSFSIDAPDGTKISKVNLINGRSSGTGSSLVVRENDVSGNVIFQWSNSNFPTTAEKELSNEVTKLSLTYAQEAQSNGMLNFSIEITLAKK